MNSCIDESLKPYFDEYEQLLKAIEQANEEIGQNESFINDYMQNDDVNPEEDEVIHLMGTSIADANDESNRCSARLNEIDDFLIKNNMVPLIYKSRLSVVKRIAELEKQLPVWAKLEQEKEKRIAEYIKTDPTSPDIAEIMLKVGDKKFRANCLKLDERKQYYSATDARYVLERMEMATTKMLVPENMLQEKVDGKGIK